MKTANYNDVLNAAAELAGRTRDKIPPSEATMLKGYFAADLAEVWNKHPWNDLIVDPFYQAAPVGRRFLKNESNGNPPHAPLTGQVNTDGSALATFATAAPHGLATGNWVVISGAGHAFFNGTFQITVTDPQHFTYVIMAQNAASGDNGVTATLGPELGDILGVYTADPSLTTRCRPVGFTTVSNAVVLEEDQALVFVEYMLPYQDLLAVADANLPTTTIPFLFKNYLAYRAAGLLLKSDSQDSSAGVNLGLAETTLASLVNRVIVPAWRSGVRLHAAPTKIFV